MALWLITESEAQLDYFLANGVVPSSVILYPPQFGQVATYLGKDADILVVIHGLTTFKMSEVNQLCRDLLEFKAMYKEVTILSDVPLTIPLEYYLYEGDLFEGTVWLAKGSKKYRLDNLGSPILKEGKDTVYAKGNVIMKRFGKYRTQSTGDKMSCRLIKPRGFESVALEDNLDEVLLKKLKCFEKDKKCEV